jgi:hypothetical protein
MQVPVTLGVKTTTPEKKYSRQLIGMAQKSGPDLFFCIFLGYN